MSKNLLDWESIPPQHLESELRKQGYHCLAGTDEVGRGCLAGPVVAAAVIFPPEISVSGIKDSKLLSPLQREKLYSKIIEAAIAWGVGVVDVEEIDRINIFQASLQAMVQAIQNLSHLPQFILIDGAFPIPYSLPQKPVIKGDRHCLSISAASIVAKVTRDRLMTDLEKDYPDFSFSVHKGYPTQKHRQEIKQFGILPIHRKSFRLLKS